MRISFTKLHPDTKHTTIYEYSFPMSIVNKMDNFIYQADHEYVFLFASFNKFNLQIHGTAIDYFFKDMINQLETNFIDKKDMVLDVTYYNSIIPNKLIMYSFRNTDKIIKKLNKRQLIFLCRVVHALQLNSYMAAIFTILIQTHKMNSNNIKQKCHSRRFKVKIMSKKNKTSKNIQLAQYTIDVDQNCLSIIPKN